MDYQNFSTSKFIPRREFVAIPELKPFFGAEIAAALSEFENVNGRSATPVEAAQLERQTVGFWVRSLSGPELGAAFARAKERKNWAAIADGFLSGNPSRVVDAIRQRYGADDIPDEDAENIYLVLAGMEMPDSPDDLKLDTVRKIYEILPVDFRALANAVRILTGKGYLPGE